jgi:formylglycine-generating enzyme required for sulfatase activity
VKRIAILTVCIADLIAIVPTLVGYDTHSTFKIPVMVQVRSGTFNYRPAGDFLRAGKSADPSIETIAIDRPLSIMKHLVTAAEYQRCVDEGACDRLTLEVAVDDYPVVQVSWRDTDAYATWLSHKTGVHYRLPTDQEWAFAAGGLFRDDALPDINPSDPAQRWLAKYSLEANRDSVETDKGPRPIGRHSANENGLLGIAGDVWEWTNTCFVRQALDGSLHRIGKPIINCGVRVVEGRHRTYVSDFIRDARTGGCQVGSPPTHLGFRLVLDDDDTHLLRSY